MNSTTKTYLPAKDSPGIDIQFHVTEGAVEERLPCPKVQHYQVLAQEREHAGKLNKSTPLCSKHKHTRTKYTGLWRTPRHRQAETNMYVRNQNTLQFINRVPDSESAHLWLQEFFHGGGPLCWAVTDVHTINIIFPPTAACSGHTGRFVSTPTPPGCIYIGDLVSGRIFLHLLLIFISL